MSENVGKNAAWLMAATMLNKVIAFLTFAIVAKFVGPTVTGTYFYGVSVTSVFVIIADLGLTPVVIRAISAAREDGERVLGAVLRLKCLLIPLAVLGSLGWIVVTRQTDFQTLGTVAVACFVMSADATSLVLYGALRGRQNLKPESLGMFVGQILTAVGSFFAAFFHFGPIGLAVALFLGSGWNVVWAFVQMRRFGIVLLTPHASDYRRIAVEAVPFGVSGIAVKLYSYVDSILIKAYQGAEAVGQYAVAYKMTYALQFIPLTFIAALYPALAKQWSEKRFEEVQRTFLESMRFLAAIGCIIAAGLSALAPRIILTVYGKTFSGAIAPLEILPWALLPIFIDFPVGSLLNASHRAHLKTAAQLGTMVINVALNLILVPKTGPVGAAIAGAISFWALMFLGFIFARRDVGLWPMMSIVLRSTLVAVASWFVWRVIGYPFPFLVAATFGGVCSLFFAYLFGLITKKDLHHLSRLRRKKITEEDPIHAE